MFVICRIKEGDLNQKFTRLLYDKIVYDTGTMINAFLNKKYLDMGKLHFLNISKEFCGKST